MLQYLIILLDDTSVSYCHYENLKKERRLISLENLKKGIIFAMKENLMIQFVYPDYDLPNEYKELIETIDHVNIRPMSDRKNVGADILVLNGWEYWDESASDSDGIYILRTDKDAFFSNYKLIAKCLRLIKRLNIVFTDIDSFKEKDFERYNSVLEELVESIGEIYKEHRYPQLNILTDRIILEKMNNCNAGWENITLAPNGKFYICPAFYLEDSCSIGELGSGLEIKNSQLYKLEYAPICKNAMLITVGVVFGLIGKQL